MASKVLHLLIRAWFRIWLLLSSNCDSNILLHRCAINLLLALNSTAVKQNKNVTELMLWTIWIWPICIWARFASQYSLAEQDFAGQHFPERFLLLCGVKEIWPSQPSITVRNSKLTLKSGFLNISMLRQTFCMWLKAQPMVIGFHASTCTVLSLRLPQMSMVTEDTFITMPEPN